MDAQDREELEAALADAEQAEAAARGWHADHAGDEDSPGGEHGDHYWMTNWRACRDCAGDNPYLPGLSREERERREALA
jgi:hypothetical protein